MTLRIQKVHGSTKPTRPRSLDPASPRVLALLRLYREEGFDYLTAPQLHTEDPIQGAYFDYRADIVQPSSEDPNNFIVAPLAQKPQGANYYRHLVYGLPKGRRPWHPHTVYTNFTRFSFYYGCRKHGFKFIHWSKAKAITERVSEEALIDRNNIAIPLKGANARGDRRVYKPDDCFLIDYGNHTYRRFLKEDDRGTEPLTSKSSSRHKSIENMFEQIHEVVRDKLYRTHLGFRDCLFVIVTTTEERRKAMMDLWARMYGPATYVLFLVFPEWQPHPDARLLEEPALRVGHPPFDLKEPPNVVQKTRA